MLFPIAVITSWPWPIATSSLTYFLISENITFSLVYYIFHLLKQNMLYKITVICCSFIIYSYFRVILQTYDSNKYIYIKMKIRLGISDRNKSLALPVGFFAMMVFDMMIIVVLLYQKHLIFQIFVSMVLKLQVYVYFRCYHLYYSYMFFMSFFHWLKSAFDF